MDGKRAHTFTQNKMRNKERTYEYTYTYILIESEFSVDIYASR